MEPAGTVTVAGTLRDCELAATATTAPPVGAAFDRVAEQLAEFPGLKTVGLQDSAVRVVAPLLSVTVVVCEALFRLAVMVTLWLVVKAPAVAVKFALTLPDEIATDAGTVRADELLDTATVIPLAPAALVRLTAQLALAPLLSVAGEHETRLTTVAEVRDTDVVCETPL